MVQGSNGKVMCMIRHLPCRTGSRTLESVKEALRAWISALGTHMTMVLPNNNHLRKLSTDRLVVSVVMEAVGAPGEYERAAKSLMADFQTLVTLFSLLVCVYLYVLPHAQAVNGNMSGYMIHHAFLNE